MALSRQVSTYLHGHPGRCQSSPSITCAGRCTSVGHRKCAGYLVRGSFTYLFGRGIVPRYPDIRGDVLSFEPRDRTQ
jgi:hypothetical protein